MRDFVNYRVVKVTQFLLRALCLGRNRMSAKAVDRAPFRMAYGVKGGDLSCAYY